MNNYPHQKPLEPSASRPRCIETVKQWFYAYGVDESLAARFWAYYERRNWRGRDNRPIRDWRQAARGWLREHDRIEYGKEQLSKLRDFLEASI